MKYLLLMLMTVWNTALLAQTKRPAQAVQAGFVSTDTRFSSEEQPNSVLPTRLHLKAWKGEKLHAQVAVWAAKDMAGVSVSASDLQSKSGSLIVAKNISTSFLGFVWTDEFGEGCGERRPQDFDSTLVADPIHTGKKTIVLQKNKVQPVWVSIQVPAGTPAGIYSGKIRIRAGKEYNLNLSIEVLDRVLPPPARWSFRLDLWQHPAAIARVHKVALWSDAHFAAMKDYYTLLAGAGQKNITASIVEEPWGHQTYDDFPGLIKWTKKKSGGWQYDYTLFDRYIQFVMNCGINQRINCYSMVPWKIAFRYYDESLGRDTVFTGNIGTPAYDAFWKEMLTDFTRHLKAKGWFGITAIAMDERPMPAMQAVIRLLKEVDKDWKIALAGDYHPEIENEVFDYCISSNKQFPPEVLQKRRAQGKSSTWYTSCTEPYPNGFTFSPPAEQAWIGWHTAARGADGYLRWAYNSWPKNPLADSRFTSWPAGDTYQVYPGPLSSLRFEKLIEGIQDYEKIRILREAYQKRGDVKSLQELEAALALFTIKALEQQPAESMVRQAKELLNK